MNAMSGKRKYFNSMMEVEQKKIPENISMMRLSKLKIINK